jgi:hypothetical protein
MKRSTRFKVLWTVWMAGGGLATSAVVYAITASVGWAVVGLLASGVVLNAVGQMVVQPMTAVGNARQTDSSAQSEVIVERLQAASPKASQPRRGAAGASAQICR